MGKLVNNNNKHCIVNAGQVVDSFDLINDKIEFFVHSPFSDVVDDNQEIDRNNAGIVLQAIFRCNKLKSAIIFGADIDFDIWEDIVKISKYYKREERLIWDCIKISHHCSWRAINSEEAKDNAKDLIEPAENINYLFNSGNDCCIIVSSSDVIPINDKNPQPPHRIAANYYKSVADERGGQFLVTMDKAPRPIEIVIDDNGLTPQKKDEDINIVLPKSPTPKAGDLGD